MSRPSVTIDHASSFRSGAPLDGAARIDAMVRTLNQSLEVERVGRLAAQFALELTAAAGATCLVLADGMVRVIGTHGTVPVPCSDDGDRRGSAERGSAARSIRDAAPVVEYTDGRASSLAIPLLVGGRAIGAVTLHEAAGSPDDALAAVAPLIPHLALAIENSRLFSASARAMRDAAILARTANELARASTPAEFYAGLSLVAETSLGASGVGVYLADAETGAVDATHITGVEAPLAARLRDAFWTSAAGRVVRDDRARFCDDLRRTSDRVPDEPSGESGDDARGDAARGRAADGHEMDAALVEHGVRAVALLPLREGRVLGVLALRFATPHRFDSTEQRLLEDFATQVSIALRNVRQIQDLQRRTARLAAVARVQQAIPRLRRDEVYAEIAHAVASVLDVSAVALLGIGGRNGEGTVRPLYVAVEGVAAVAGPHEPGIPLTVLGAVGDAYASGRPEIRHHPQWSWALGGLAGIEPAREQSELAAPIQHGPRLLGVLHVQSDRRDAFDTDDVELIGTIARQAGAAIEMARLFEAQQRERELAEGSADIARAALANATASDAASAILGIVQRLVPFAGAALALVDSDASPDDDPLTPRQGEGTGEDDAHSLAYVAATGAAAPLLGRRIAMAASLLPDSLTPGVPLHRVRGGRADSGATRAPEEDAALPAGLDLTTIALASKGRLVGLLLVLTADPFATGGDASAAIDDAGDDALIRLSAPIALALDTLALGRNERRRRDRERTLATALAALEQPVFLLDPDGRVRDLNAAAMRAYASTREGLLGLALEQLVVEGGEHRMPHGVSGLTRPLRGEEVSEPLGGTDGGVRETSRSLRAARQEHRRMDGTVFPAESTRAPIRDDHGRLVGAVVLVRDLTTEYRIEEHLRQHEKLAALGELVAGVAHELNNPLTGVSAFAQLLMEDDLSADQAESVRLIKREADRAVGVIRDLLLFSRKTGPRVSEIDINDLVQSTVRLRAYHLRTAGVELTLELDQPLPDVHGDPQKLQQVLVNLLVNAEDAVTRSVVRKIILRTARCDGYVFIDVADTGYGIAPEIRGHVFEPFYTTKPAGAGTGLGLSVSYGIIESHGGTLTIESEPGAGATFRIALPIPNLTPSPRAE